MKTSPTSLLLSAAIGLLPCSTLAQTLVDLPARRRRRQYPTRPPSHIQASDRPDDSGGHILVTWVISPDDQREVSVLLNSAYQTSFGPAAYPARPGISGYRIYRSTADATAELVGQRPLCR